MLRRKSSSKTGTTSVESVSHTMGNTLQMNGIMAIPCGGGSREAGLVHGAEYGLGGIEEMRRRTLGPEMHFDASRVGGDAFYDYFIHVICMSIGWLMAAKCRRR